MASAKLLEIACFSLDSALIAQAAGADRIELCENYEAGGNSPSIPEIESARQKISIPLHVMIRPRPDDFGFPFTLSPAGDFNYTEMEIQWMIGYIIACNYHGIDGVVLGALTKQKQIDMKACERFRAAADGMQITFHRAIDECQDPEKAMSQLIDLGFQRVLTSGGKKNALDNLERIKQLQESFGEKITIIPGGGIRSSQIPSLISTGCREFHSSAITGSSGLADAGEIKMLKQFLTAAS